MINKLILYIPLFVITTINGQNHTDNKFTEKEISIFQEIERQGIIAYTNSLSKGSIENLKNASPKKDTWTYSKLEAYKNRIGDSITYGSFIQPSARVKNLYSYNYFAIDSRAERTEYFFVAIFSFEVLDDKLKKEGAYLFTEEKSLKNWWNHISRFCFSKEKEMVPPQFLFEVCPPYPSTFK
ncbi:hypothetical protein [Aquimarina sp. AU58]|uniref:hypothetical protein n=1 Tax=Aquimarina sp. AU58 TaxID=1874112 RepID=UPI000D648D71|nr:hypothetical protein [Aquimarina sp. AU58]